MLIRLFIFIQKFDNVLQPEELVLLVDSDRINIFQMMDCQNQEMKV